MSKKKTVKNQITKPVAEAISDNLVDASTISVSENLEVNPDENLVTEEAPAISEVIENTEIISDEVATDLIPANVDDLETMVEHVPDSNEPATDTVVAENTGNHEVVVEGNEPATETVVDALEVIAENTENHEVVVEGNEPVIKDTQVEEVEPKKSSKKKSDTTASTIVKRVKLVGTSYHYFRNWLKSVFRENEIQSAKFIKDPTGWNGHISIPESDKEQALKVLAQYTIDNPETKPLWLDNGARKTALCKLIFDPRRS